MSVQPEMLFGRRVIYYDDVKITRDNVAEIVARIMPIHQQNAREIDRLYKIYKGKQSILSKAKDVRPEINNKIVTNFANQIVTFKTGYLLSKPIQYVSQGERKDELSDYVSQDIDKLNRYADDCNKDAKDIELAEWFHICGTSYRYVDVNTDADDDESPFETYTVDPRFNFVVYSTSIGHKPIFCVNISEKKDGTRIKNVWTDNRLFKIIDKKGTDRTIEEETTYIGGLPLIEYPANTARLGAFEIVLPLLDAINAAFSDLADGREQFINALMVFTGANIDAEKLMSLKDYGALLVPDGASVEYLVSELNQSQNADTINLMIDTMLEIVGMPQRTGGSGGTSDNGVAVEMRDGWQDASARATSTEGMFKKAEKEFLRIALNICDWSRGMKLKPSDVETHFSRLNTDNRLAKTQSFVQLLSTGKVHPELAFEISQLFSDPNAAYLKSKAYEEENIEREEKLLAETAETHHDSDGGGQM